MCTHFILVNLTYKNEYNIWIIIYIVKTFLKLITNLKNIYYNWHMISVQERKSKWNSIQYFLVSFFHILQSFYSIIFHIYQEKNQGRCLSAFLIIFMSYRDKRSISYLISTQIILLTVEWNYVSKISLKFLNYYNFTVGDLPKLSGWCQNCRSEPGSDHMCVRVIIAKWFDLIIFYTFLYLTFSFYFS